MGVNVSVENDPRINEFLGHLVAVVKQQGLNFGTPGGGIQEVQSYKDLSGDINIRGSEIAKYLKTLRSHLRMEVSEDPLMKGVRYKGKYVTKNRNSGAEYVIEVGIWEAESKRDSCEY